MLIRVNVGLLERMLFGCAEMPVRIEGVGLSKEDPSVLIFDISGPDVPQGAFGTAVYTERCNRMGQRFTEVKLEADKC